MSRAAKLTLVGTSLFAVGTVFFVHFQQQSEKAVCTSPCPPFYLQYSLAICNISANAIQQAMHKGVIRDVEQQRVKKERQLDFEMQKALEEEYRKVQNVRDGGAALDKPR
jgi:protein PET117